MAIELITGKAGTPHVDSSDVGAYQAATVGSDTYILEGCAASMADANHISLTAGSILANGRHVILSGSNSAEVTNGQSGYKRNDVLALHYSRDASGVESVELVVVRGTATTGTASDPSMPTSGSILDGVSDTHIPIYRIPFDGLTPGSPVRICEPNPTANNAKGTLSVEHGGTGYNGNNLAPYAVLRANGTAGSGMRGVATADGALYATGANKEPQFGTLLIGQGGTGGTTAKAAQYNLLSNMANKTNALTDDWKIIVGHGTPNTTNGMVATMSASLMWTYISGKMGDYVEAQGTSSNWEYVKFANGIFICSQSRDISSKAFPAFGNQFRTNAVSMSLPFKVKSAVVHTCGEGEVWGVASAAGNDTNTITAFYYAASSNSRAFTAYTIAIGRWK